MSQLSLLDFIASEPLKGAPTLPLLNAAQEHIPTRDILQSEQPTLSAAVPPANPKSDAIEDAGRVVHGARKHLSGRAIIDAIGEDAAAAILTGNVAKTRIWPRPDYEALRASGLQPANVHLLKQIYDKLPAGPNNQCARNRFGLAQYTTAITIMQDAALLVLVGTADTPASPIADTDGKADYLLRNAIVEGIRSARTKVGAAAKAACKPALTALLSEPWMAEFADDCQKLLRYGAEGLLGQTGVDDATACGYNRDYTFATKIAVDWWKNRKHARTISTAPRIHTKPILERIERSGPAHPEYDDIGSEDFLKLFGFSGLQWGNWCDQAERRKHLTMAALCLHDLADVLGIPANRVSLDGHLAVAIGARGRGGQANAHFEAGHNIFNLSKPRGAGSTSHEWFHALDYWLGNTFLISSFSRRRLDDIFATGDKKAFRKPGEMLPPIRDILPIVCAAVHRQPPSIAEWRAALVQQRSDIDKTAERYATSITKLERQAAAATDKHVAKRYRSSADEYRSYQRSLDKRAAKIEQNLRDLDEEQKEGGRSCFVWWDDSLPEAEAAAKTADRLLNHGQLCNDATTDTAFWKAACKFGSDYWSRPYEVMARCFEAFVHDKLTALGRRSDYLVHSTHGEPGTYPVGRERALMNALFERLFAELRPYIAAGGERETGMNQPAAHPRDRVPASA